MKPAAHQDESNREGDFELPSSALVTVSGEHTYREVSGVGACEFTLEKIWFLQFFTGILVCVNNGACFCFGIFSPFMKTGGFRYTQSQINIVSTVGVFLSYFSLPTGFIYDWKGPTAVLVTGTALNVFGWLGMWLEFKDHDNPILSSSVVVMSILYGISQLSASFFETGSMLTNLKAFACYKGRVVLIQKTFMGLGSSLVAQIHIAFFERRFNTVGPFFLFLALYSSATGVLSYFFMRLPEPSTRCLGLNVEDKDTEARGGGEPRLFLRPFNVGSVLLFIAVGFVLVVSLIENYHDIASTPRLLIGLCTVLICASFSSMMFVTPSYEVNVGGYRYACDDAGVEDQRLIDKGDATEEEWQVVAAGVVNGKQHAEENAANAIPTATAAATTITAAPRYDADGAALWNASYFTLDKDDIVLNDAALWSNLTRPEIWLLWYVCFASWGAMTLVSSNSSQIYQATDVDNFSLTVNTVFVSIYGVASAVGRIIVGAAHPIFEQKKIAFSLFLVAPPAMNLIGLPAFLLCPTSLLFFPFFIVGLAVGISWGSTVLIVTAFFTSRNCGKHYSWLYTAGMLSPLVFNIMLFGPVYDHYSAVQGRDQDRSCSGRICFALPFLVCTAINVLAIPVALLFVIRTVKNKGITT